uniref:Fe-S cluster assembly protein SufD n=1 Tax=Dunaliella tertiolecta TaxID=3047 RepID=A0A7S3VGQ3_DUNTE|mmetsp:Transcript_8196/g.21867  ORF Transcript_8196/g.21867 Transcript_8196/m.21867 type:complete len:518 (+) Transcript_8196:78-1631(+)
MLDLSHRRCCSGGPGLGKSSRNICNVRDIVQRAPLQSPRWIQVQSASPSTAASTKAPEDKFIATTWGRFQQDAPQHDPSIAALHASSWSAIPTMRMPSTRNEEYRFTDISPLLKSTVVPAQNEVPVSSELVSSLVPEEAATTCAVVVNGVLRQELSNLSGLQKAHGAYVGGLAGAPKDVTAKLGQLSASRGGPFALLNGGAARDALVVSLPQGVAVETPLYVLHLTSAGAPGTTNSSAPRMLLHAGKGASCTLIEEFVGLNEDGTAAALEASPEQAQQPPYLCNNVAEMFLESKSQVTHSLASRDGPGGANFKSTFVSQARKSSYNLTEARLGGMLTRHDLCVVQEGMLTETNMRHFVLAGANQLHDLHTQLHLDHPEGQADQLHKCIVTSPTGRGVFDGNVRVNQKAQRTDAGQLSRNLLLAPKATVNVKPNLMIIADDVKCTHGCAVSDLSEEELFYFRARGISAISARQALVASFGAEVTQRLSTKAVVERVRTDMLRTLATVDLVGLTNAREA